MQTFIPHLKTDFTKRKRVTGKFHEKIQLYIQMFSIHGLSE
ncbi:MAG: hypothetical protein R2860_10695 [Desulfobacterales bacterium]